MKELIEYIAKALVENPDEVSVIEEQEGRRTILKLQVDPNDMGRVIGREGRVAEAMRTLLRAATARSGEQILLVIRAQGSTEDEQYGSR